MTPRALTEQAFFVLAALTDGPRHGYGIAHDVGELSDGRVEVPIGTLYGVLDRLVAERHVELDREEAHQGRLRRYYRLTDVGREALADDTRRQAANAALAASRLDARAVRGGAAPAGGMA